MKRRVRAGKRKITLFLVATTPRDVVSSFFYFVLQKNNSWLTHTFEMARARRAGCQSPNFSARRWRSRRFRRRCRRRRRRHCRRRRRRRVSVVVVVSVSLDVGIFGGKQASRLPASVASAAEADTAVSLIGGTLGDEQAAAEVTI